MKKTVTLCIIGAGDRGTSYANYTRDCPGTAKVVAVAEPREHYRKTMADRHNIPAENVFQSWEQAASSGRKLADAVVIATQDKMHTAPALAFIEQGYDILLEKPMAPTKDECIQIARAADAPKLIFAVCHVLRYTPYTEKLKDLIHSNVIGEVVSIQHMEPIGYDHFAHSFVRGNWRNESESSFMLMAKSCHDMDWLAYIVGSKMVKVSSFGSLKYFRDGNSPAGAGRRCTECPVESDCPYSARKIYLDKVKAGHVDWPVNTITSELTIEGVQKAIHTGPYGRCVYRCDNDVLDHQVVAMEFQSGASGVFTATAFTENTDRRTRIFGTHGELCGDGNTIDLYDFLSNSHETINTAIGDDQIPSGHGGGDYGLMKRFVEAVARKDQSLVLSGPNESLESYLSVFAAEEARTKRRIVEV